MNVLHVSLVLSVFFYFLTVRVFISITTALKGYTINSQVPRSPVIHIQPGLAYRRFQNRLHLLHKVGPFSSLGKTKQARA